MPPAVLIRSAVSSIVSGRAYGDGWPVMLRPVQYTVAPVSPSARAIPRPAPRVAPATTATCPDSEAALGEAMIPGQHPTPAGGNWKTLTTSVATSSNRPHAGCHGTRAPKCKGCQGARVLSTLAPGTLAPWHLGT